MNALLRSRRPAWAFPLAAITVYAVCLAVLARAHSPRAQAVLPAAALVDILVTVPVLYWLLVVRGRGANPRTLFPVLALSVVAAGVVVGERTPVTRVALLVLGAALELALVVRVLFAMRAGRRAGGELPERVHAAVADLLGPSPVSRVVAEEVLLFVLAIAGPWLHADERGQAFSHHRESGRIALVSAFAALAAIELFGMHAVLVPHHPKLAWALTALSAWGLLWLLGDLQAWRLLRTRVTTTALQLRIGTLWRADVPLAAIAAVITRDVERRVAAERLAKAAPGTTPTVLLLFREPQPVRGLYGITRRREALAIAPDDRARFVAALRDAGVAVDDII